MPIKVQLDENGHAVLKDGMPVCVHEDGKTFVHDVAAAVRKIENFNEERDRHTAKYDQLNERLEAYEDIDPDQARAALDTVAKLDQKQLIDTEGVEALRKELTTSFDEKYKAYQKTAGKEKKKLQSQLQGKDELIYKLMVSEQFHTSPFFTGDEPKTKFKPAHAVKIFGEHFKVEEENGSATVRAYDKHGTLIYSRENHGEPADFNEAIEIIINNDPERDDILIGSKGSQRQASHSTQHSKDAPKDSLSLIKRGLEKSAAAG